MMVASSVARSASNYAVTKFLSPIQDQHLAGLALTARDELQADLALVDLRGGQRERSGGAVHREQRVQPKAPEEAAVAGAIAIVGGIPEPRALGRLNAACAFHRGGVDPRNHRRLRSACL
jgi:hypothetical protein